MKSKDIEETTSKKPKPWGKGAKKAMTTTAANMLKELKELRKLKKAKAATTLSPDLLRKLEKVRKVAPPHPKTALYTWLISGYHMRRALGDTKADLLALAKAKGSEKGTR